MKSIKIISAGLGLAVAFAALPAAAQPAAPPRCINVKNIADTISKDDGATLTFRLRDGTTVVNRLRTKCESLKFGGFSWVTPPGGEICANAQTLQAETTGEICRLGNFDSPVKLTAAR
jgi:hypothetical protein